MERRGLISRLLATTKREIPVGNDRLNGVMEAYGVSNSKQLPLAIRAQLAREEYQGHINKTGEVYQGGDVPTLGLYFETLEKLGPDALAVCIQEGLISPKLFGKNPVEEVIIEFEKASKREGWSQASN